MATAQSTMARVYITGNHEYFSGAEQWVEHMAGLGWTVLHNRHVLVERGGDRLAIAGTDDLTGAVLFFCSDTASFVTGQILGIHMIGPEAAEIMQAAAVAVKAGLTKQQFDDTVAIHPTMAEELVLMR